MPDDEVADLVEELTVRSNPTLRGIRKVESLFRKRIDFDSKDELAGALGGGMRPPVLNAILVKLMIEKKIIINDDGSMVWIYAVGDKRLMDCWRNSGPIPGPDM